MANTIKPVPRDYVLNELSRLGLSPNALIAFRELFQAVDRTVNKNGEVQAQANITGRTEPLATTVVNITPGGQVNSLLNVVADRNTDNIADGIGSPLLGGKRGAIGFDANNRLAGSFRANPLNVSSVPTSSTSLSNDGVSTSITIAAITDQFGDGTVSYNSGSVDPGAFGGPNYIYTDDPTFSGGAVSYVTSTVIQTQSAANGRVLEGSITTVNGSAKTGGGFSGGSGGHGGGRGYVQ